jgi:hypothetical protein
LDVVVEGEQLSRSRIGGAWALAKSSPCSNTSGSSARTVWTKASTNASIDERPLVTVRFIDGQVCTRGRRHSSLYFSIASPTTGS